jgi:hypothetical protein
MTPGIALTDS